MERIDEKKSEDGVISRKFVAESDSTSAQRGMTTGTTDSGDKRSDETHAEDASRQKPERSTDKGNENVAGDNNKTPSEAHQGKRLPRGELVQNETKPSKSATCDSVGPDRIQTGGNPDKTAKVRFDDSEGNDHATVDKPPMKPLDTSVGDDKLGQITSSVMKLNSNVAGQRNAQPPTFEASKVLLGKTEAKSSTHPSSTRNPVSNVGSGNPLEDPSNLKLSVQESSQSAPAKTTIPSQELIAEHGSKSERVSTTDVKISKSLPLLAHEHRSVLESTSASTNSAQILGASGSDSTAISLQTLTDASSSQKDSAPRIVEQATVSKSSPAPAHRMSEGVNTQISPTPNSSNSTKTVAVSTTDPDSRSLQKETSIYATQQQSSAAVAIETRQLNAGEFHSTEDAAIAAARSPLTSLYAPYICNSADSSLEDARNRLKKAITQTRYLRHAFTERIYGKYRVCLKPPPEADEIISQIIADPVGRQRKLKEEMAVIREEKEVEKKEAAKLNIELAQSATPERASVLATVENAEQLMYISAGLNLVVLPEDKQADVELLRGYDEQSPVNPFTGKRVTKNISQAAAAAGEVILDRTRKAAAMRVERQRRRQLQLLRGDATNDGDAEANYSRLQVLSTAAAPPTGSVQAKVVTSTIAIPKESSASSFRRAPATTVKTGRSRAPGSLSANVLLNLNATADEMKIEDRPSAATAALIDRGVGLSIQKTTQQRLRHPHPESSGGRRRASANGPSKKDNATPPEPFLQAFLALTLPPLPATKERIERKPLHVQNPADDDADGAADAIRAVLRNFISDQEGRIVRPIPKISLLNSFRKNEADASARRNPQSYGRQSDMASTKQTAANSFLDGKETKVHPSRPLDSVFVYSVLHSLGILSDSNSQHNSSPFTLPDLNDDNHGMATDKLKILRKEIVSDQATFIEKMMQPECLKPESIGLKRSTDGESLQSEPPAKNIRLSSDEPNSVPLEHIRGGGEVIGRADDGENRKRDDTEITSKTSKEVTSAENATGTIPLPKAQSKKRKRADSSPGLPSAAVPRGQRAASISHIPLPGSQRVASETVHSYTAGHSEAFNPMNPYFASAFHHIHHPASGELAEYLGSLQNHQHVPNLMSTTTHTIGYPPGIPGFSVSDPTATTAAARVMLARDQHTAALLGGYHQSAVFPSVGPHPATMTAFLGAPNAPMVAGNPTTKLAKGGNKPPPPPDPSEGSNKPKVERQEDHDKKLPTSYVDSTATVEANESKTKAGASNLNPTGNIVTHNKSDPLSPLQESLVKSGHFHKAAEQLLPSQYSTAIDCLLSTSATVPIPKGLVSGPLKERLNTPGFKNAGINSAPPINRDIVSAVILVWLWDEHKSIFKQAFEKNGRIDVDPNCKWFIIASIDAAVRDLSLAIADSIARGEGAFAEASLASKSNSVPESSSVIVQENIEAVTTTNNIEVCTASIVSKALAAEVSVDAKMNSVIPRYQKLLSYLDESRLGALRSKSQERTLLAALVARKCTMSESFAYAYVSSVVRAGDALGHGQLFETVQDEATMSSTMVPHDIFTDDDGYWEDPCKPENGFTAGLKGDELIRRAHARALIHKALRKLQDRHGIRGGTSTYGALIDPGEESATMQSVGSGTKSPASSASPRPGKRRVSLLTEPRVYPGTGSAAARSWAVYDPKHFCPPLEWYPEDLCNAPYGLHSRGERYRSLPMSSGKDIDEKWTKKLKRSTSFAVASRPDSPESKMLRSTREIAWGDVASIFRRVEVPKKSRAQAQVKEHSIRLGETIFAPFCRPIEDLSSDGDESDTEEDLKEENVLARHQVVLDEMKAKLNAFLEARKKEKEERKIRYSK